MTETTLDPPQKYCDLLDVTLPEYQIRKAEDIPSPYHDLLVHKNDMTSTLEQWFKSPIHLQTLKVIRAGCCLDRQVLLKTQNEQIVEFGAIQIQLKAFSGGARQDVLGCYLPLGQILKDRRIPFRCELQHFFSIQTNEALEKLLKLERGYLLYGRHNRLVRTDGERIADVLEIIPPIEG